MREIRHKTEEMAGYEPMDYVTRQMTEIPSTTFLMAAMASVLGSMFLLLLGRRWESMFVGLWAPTIMALGMFAKFLGFGHRGRF